MNARPDRLRPLPSLSCDASGLVPGIRICLCDDDGRASRYVDMPLTAFLVPPSDLKVAAHPRD